MGFSQGLRFQAFLTEVATRQARPQYLTSEETYNLFAVDGELSLTATIWRGTLPPGVLAGGYTQEQNDADLAEFEAAKSTWNQPLIPRDSAGHAITKINAPTESDGKPNFVPVPFTTGLYMLISSRGDDLVDGVVKRGQGTKLLLKWDGSTGDAEREALATMHETVELHDGHVDYDPADWDVDDEWSIFIRIPASEVTANGSNEGDCNLYMAQQLTPWDSGTSYSQGDLVTHNYVNYVCIETHSNQEPPNDTYWLHTANVIIPAAGDGAYDLTKIVAVPYEDQGYWDYDIWADALTPHGAGADWMLFDFQLDDVYQVRNVACGNHMGFWELDAYKVEPIYPRWQLGFKCNRHDHVGRGAAWIGGHYTCFRKTTT